MEGGVSTVLVYMYSIIHVIVLIRPQPFCYAEGTTVQKGGVSTVQVYM